MTKIKLELTDDFDRPVAVNVGLLGAATDREISIACGLSLDAVRPALYKLAIKGVVEPFGVVVNVKRRIAGLYWRPVPVEGEKRSQVWKARKESKENYPETWASIEIGKRKRRNDTERKPRAKVKAGVLKALEVGGNRSVDDLMDATGFSYGPINRRLHELEAEGVVKFEKRIYGRGRPQLLWSLVKKDEDPMVTIAEDDVNRLWFTADEVDDEEIAEL